MREVQHILMVDDDADDQFLFVEALKQIQQSCTCEIANNGLEALEKLDTLPEPEIIFLDVNMPIMNGFDCLRSLRAHDSYKHIPVIIYTTTKDAESVNLFRNLGANAYFQKPINFSQLQFKLKKLLGMHTPNQKYWDADFVI